MNIQEAKKIREKQELLISLRKPLWKVLTAEEPHKVKYLAELGYNEAVKAYNEDHIGQAYFEALEQVKKEAISINVQIAMLPKIPLQTFLALKEAAQ